MSEKNFERGEGLHLNLKDMHNSILALEHVEAWTIKLSHVLSFDRIDFAKIGLCFAG